MKPVQWLDAALFDAVSDAAKNSSRRRRNRNFHAADDFPAHRLLNAIEPDSYIVPHRHLDAAKDETILCVRGRIGLIVFDDDGVIREARVLDPSGPCVGIDIPHGVFHSLVALLPGSIIFEAKAGPFMPLSPAERAPWAPAEGDADAVAYLESLRRKFA